MSGETPDAPGQSDSGEESQRFVERLAVGDSDVVLVAVVLGAVYLVYLGIAVLLGVDPIGTVTQLTRFIGLFAIVALALNLHWGYTGLFNIGIAGFMMVGIYVAAVVSKEPLSTADAGATLGAVGGLGLPLWVGIPVGALAAALLGLIVALPALRLRADYLAIVTIGVSEIVRTVLKNRKLESFSVGGNRIGFGGGDGLALDWGSEAQLLMEALFLGDVYDGLVAALDGVASSPQTAADRIVYSLILLVFLVGYHLLLQRMGRSPFGRVLKAIREDEEAASSLGKDTARFKIIVFMIGCGLMGVAGVLWFMNSGGLGTANARQFRPRVTFFVWIALIIGGAGSNTGSVLGGALFAAVLFQGPRYLQDIISQFVDLSERAPGSFGAAMAPLSGSLDPAPLLLYTVSQIANLQLLIMGVVLVWLMHNRPDGLLGGRKEYAAAVPIGRQSRRSDRGDGPSLATDGGTHRGDDDE